MWLKLLTLCLILLLNFVIAGEVGDECIPNANHRDGICKEVTNCAVAIRAIKQLDKHPFRRCGFDGIIEVVCCPVGAYDLPVQTRRPTRRPPTTVPIPSDKYGDNVSPKSLRIADRECQKIVESSIPPLGLHIIGGETASLGEFPHMVALGYERSDSYEFLCGGSLISDTYILSAAHCIDTLELIRPTIARLGVIELGSGQFNEESDIRIASIALHPEYSRPTKYHDLALIKLEKPVKFSVNLNAVCLYTNIHDPKVPLTITGWGKTSTTRDTKSTILLKANVTVVATSKCGESYTNWRKLPQGIANTQICAGDPQGLRDTCQGDSGGPLQGLTAKDGQYRLVGVTSFGRGCGSPVPGVYTRIAQYLDWIESVVWPQ